MKKSLHILCNNLLDNATVEQVSNYLDELDDREQIDMLNWAQLYPYKPQTFFQICRTNNSLFLKFWVEEQHIRAIHTEDLSPVSEDSCVEFFCKIDGEDYYYNFEFNCIGTCLASSRRSRKEGKVYLTDEELRCIERLPSLGRNEIESQSGNFAWELTVKIPFSVLKIKTNRKNLSLSANFYKCGDKTPQAHYLSWSPILTEKPDFHRPEFFGEIKF